MRDKILTELYKSEELTELLRKMKPDNLREDLKQELFLSLCELPEEKLLNLYNAKQLRFYVIGTVLRMVQSKNSRFYYKYKKQIVIDIESDEAEEVLETFSTTQETEVDIREFEHAYHAKVDGVIKAINELNWYHREVLKLYLEYGSAMKVVKDFNERIGMSIPKNQSSTPLKRQLQS
jgi:hypothetical protein